MFKLDRLFKCFKNQCHQAAMSLIEIIIVIALIGTIMTVIISNLTTTQDEALRDAASLGAGKIMESLQVYRVHHRAYPKTEEGLDALVQDPGSNKWRGPYIEESKLRDPWDEPYEYRLEGGKPVITSAGPDRTKGTEDDVVYPEQTQ